MSSKKIFDLTKEGEIAEIHKLLSNSDDEEEDIDSEEEDAIIPDFREDTEDEEKALDTPSTSFQLHTQSFRTSDSSEDDSHISNEDKPNISNENKLVIINPPPKLFGKDRFKWSGRKGKLHRTPKKNLIVHVPGNKKEAKAIKSGLEAWKLCFTEENLNLIVQFTNKEIAVQRLQYKSDRPEEDEDVENVSVRPSFARDTNDTEILALIGLLYYAGVMKMQEY